MKAYIVKFQYIAEGVEGKLNAEEMFLCLFGQNPREAFEKFVQVTGGETRQCYFLSLTGENKIEMFWDKERWQFFTIPPREDA